MVGFEDSVKAEECHDPPRIFPRAMLLGMAVAATIYVAVAVLSSMLVPASQLGGAGSGALFTVLEAGAPGFPLAVFAAIGLFAVVNSALINMLMASRLLYGMANERIIPRPFGKVHETPPDAVGGHRVHQHRRDRPRGLGRHLAARRDHGAAAARGVHDRQRRGAGAAPQGPRRPPALPRADLGPYTGIVLCGFLATPLSGRPLKQFVVAGILLAVGAVLWVVNRLIVGPVEVDPTRIAEG
jgi:basic amino acid/polyamine antiporter, APA family